MMSSALLAALVVTIALLPPVAVAQDASVRPDTRLQMETTRKRLIVRPDAPMASAFRDTDRAIDELAARRLTEEAAGPARRAPQLDYDVTSAIQARNLRRALRR